MESESNKTITIWEMALGKRWWWRRPLELQGGALVSKWKWANTFRSGNGFNNNSSWNSSLSTADPEAFVEDNSKKSKKAHLGGSSIDSVREGGDSVGQCCELETIRRSRVERPHQPTLPFLFESWFRLAAFSLWSSFWFSGTTSYW